MTLFRAASDLAEGDFEMRSQDLKIRTEDAPDFCGDHLCKTIDSLRVNSVRSLQTLTLASTLFVISPATFCLAEIGSHQKCLRLQQLGHPTRGGASPLHRCVLVPILVSALQRSYAMQDVIYPDGEKLDKYTVVYSLYHRGSDSTKQSSEQDSNIAAARYTRRGL